MRRTSGRTERRNGVERSSEATFSAVYPGRRAAMGGVADQVTTVATTRSLLIRSVPLSKVQWGRRTRLPPHGIDYAVHW
jgi:hypothetical protein